MEEGKEESGALCDWEEQQELENERRGMGRWIWFDAGS